MRFKVSTPDKNAFITADDEDSAMDAAVKRIYGKLTQIIPLKPVKASEDVYTYNCDVVLHKRIKNGEQSQVRNMNITVIYRDKDGED